MNLAWDVNRMSSFSLLAIGCLARNPELVESEKGTFCRFCLVGEDQTEEDGQGGYRIIVQTIPFVATHSIGAAIADAARKGDQVFIEGKIIRNHWTVTDQDGSIALVATGFRLGARRTERPADEVAPSVTPTSPVDPAGDEMAVTS
jgi:single-stranded DNA-binding protein